MARGKTTIPLGRDTVLVIPRPPKRAQELQSLKQLDILAFNQAAEEAFIRLVWQLCKETSGGRVSAREVYSEAAYELGVSAETAKRYLIKHTARRASFAWEDGKVIIRPRRADKQEEESEGGEDGNN